MSFAQHRLGRASIFRSGLGIVMVFLIGGQVAVGAEPAAPEKEGGLIVFIPPFENASNSMTGQSRIDASRGILEDILVNRHVKVVERERSDKMLTETRKNRYDSEDAKEKEIGKALGADFLVMGTILGTDKDSKSFVGNKVKMLRTTVTAKVRIRVINLTSGSVEFSEIFEGKEMYESTASGGSSTRDADSKAIGKAVSRAAGSSKFVGMLTGKTPDAPKPLSGKMIEVAFEPMPAGADVLIDGEYRGSSPLKLSLPAGKSIHVTIRKGGRQPWEATLTPSETVSRVNPDLGSEAPAAK